MRSGGVPARRRKSSGLVSFTFFSAPGASLRCTVPYSCSKSMASSVTSRPSFLARAWALRSISQLKLWGVCTARSAERSGVVTRPV